jgi:hypothetical protein
MATYLSEMGFTSGSGGPADKARMAAAVRFFTDRHERSAAAGDVRYVALVRSLRGVTAEGIGSSSLVGLAGSDGTFSFGSTTDDPVRGAWSSTEAEWLACNGSGVRDLLCSAADFGATP